MQVLNRGPADLYDNRPVRRSWRTPSSSRSFRDRFGLNADEAEAVTRPSDWDHPETKIPARQVILFEAEGWDVTDDKRRPLRVLGHFAEPLWLAVRGVAGSLPFQAESTEPEAWVAKLEAQARRFQKR